MRNDGDRREGHAEKFERVMVDVLLETSTLHPDDVAAAESLGAWDSVLLVIDLGQRLLRPLAIDGSPDTAVEGTLPGASYRQQRLVDGGAVPGGAPALGARARLG